MNEAVGIDERAALTSELHLANTQTCFSATNMMRNLIISEIKPSFRAWKFKLLYVQIIEVYVLRIMSVSVTK